MRKCRQKDLTGCNQSVVGTAPNSSLNILICSGTQSRQPIYFHRASIRCKYNLSTFQHKYPCAFRELSVKADHGANLYRSPAYIQIRHIKIISG